ncbi:3-hydroxyanthranilate 3,4-dioxygenase [Malassezia nana]|uniref:3-hydroxyanthranilate 3,4-dioxygenase n=1 Tax=Malassezia nana TaxID=180528 RepID=A0AAF0ELS4_9BASI|nr:3-hydroxyanthranilate 3,4-dioxygenase [Malassezia nana]
MIAPPFNFRKWIDDNKDLLKPPVGNKRLFNTDGYFIMVPTEELFYQVKGSVFLRVIDEGKFHCIEVKEGEFFMLPRTTHTTLTFSSG